MGISQLEGTPWHIEKAHRNENDDRRHRNRCKYYSKEKCTKLGYKCYGSAHCIYYIEVKEKNVVSSEKYISRKMIPYGEFEVMYLDDEELVHKIIGDKSEDEFISVSAPLTQEVLKNEVGTVFKINEENVKLLSKNIKYK